MWGGGTRKLEGPRSAEQCAHNKKNFSTPSSKFWTTVQTLRGVDLLNVRCQWRRSVIKIWGQGQSGKAIKLFRIKPYVDDFSEH